MQRILPIVLVAAFAVIVSWLLWRTYAPADVGSVEAPAAPPPQSELAQLQAAAAREILPKLPYQVDEVIALVRISANGGTLTYSYQLSVPLKAVNVSSFLDRLKTFLRDGACTQPAMIQVLALGGTYVYRYVDADQRSVGTIQLRQADCDT